MAERKRGLIAGFFVGIWNLINFTRRFVVNVIFVFLVIIFVIAFSIGGVKLKDRTPLVLDPRGGIVEQYSSAPAQRAFAGLFGDKIKEVQLRDILLAIDTAATDA